MIAMNVAEGSSVRCDHTPPTISVAHTRGGCQVRCLECGEVGPERESLGQAWLALRWYQRTREHVNPWVG